jgi:hypothetical protein
VLVSSCREGCLGEVLHIRKKRNVRSVMGWLLRRQLSDPGAGACCAVSIVVWELCGGGLAGVKMWVHVAGTRAGESAVAEEMRRVLRHTSCPTFELPGVLRLSFI